MDTDTAIPKGSRQHVVTKRLSVLVRELLLKHAFPRCSKTSILAEARYSIYPYLPQVLTFRYFPIGESYERHPGQFQRVVCQSPTVTPTPRWVCPSIVPYEECFFHPRTTPLSGIEGWHPNKLEIIFVSPNNCRESVPAEASRGVSDRFGRCSCGNIQRNSPFLAFDAGAVGRNRSS